MHHLVMTVGTNFCTRGRWAGRRHKGVNPILSKSIRNSIAGRFSHFKEILKLFILTLL